MVSAPHSPDDWKEFFSAVKNHLGVFATTHWPLEVDGSGPPAYLSLHRLFTSFPVPADVILLGTDGIDFGGSAERYATAIRYDFSHPNTLDIRLHGVVPLNDLASHPKLIEDMLGFEPEMQDSLKRPASIFDGSFPHCIHVVPYDVSARATDYADDLAEWLCRPSELLEAFSARTDFNARYGLNPDQLLTDEDLLQIDETTRCFVKMSDGKPLTISERHASLAHIQLIPQVPESVRRVFRQAKRLYVYSYLEYDFFTVSLHYAHLALDAALHARWSATLPPSVTITYQEKKTGKVHQQIMPNPSHVNIRDLAQRARWPVSAIKVNGKPFPYRVRSIVGELADMGLLTMWQRKVIEEFDIKIRNRLTHLEFAPVYGPSGHELETTAETINSLFDLLPLPAKAAAP